MPLFKCSSCGYVDNTACGGSFWMKPEKPQCSECLTGVWLAPFEKKTPEQMGLIDDPRPQFKGMLTKEEWM